MKRVNNRLTSVLAATLVLAMACLMVLPAGCAKESSTRESGQASTAAATSGQGSTAATTERQTESQIESKDAVIRQFIEEENPDDDSRYQYDGSLAPSTTSLTLAFRL